MDADKRETLERACEAKRQVLWRLSDLLSFSMAAPSGGAVLVVGLRPFACWDFGFERIFVSCECCVLSGTGLWLG
jgi:hypothetical protein